MVIGHLGTTTVSSNTAEDVVPWEERGEAEGGGGP